MDFSLYILPTFCQYAMIVHHPPYSLVSTVSNVITAFCLMVMTIAIVVGGTWTVQTVSDLRQTYHPDQISAMITDLGETVTLIHTLVQNTTHHSHLKGLKSSHISGSSVQPSPLEDLHLLATSIEALTNKLDLVPSLINEAHEWRHMTTNVYSKIQSAMTSL